MKVYTTENIPSSQIVTKIMIDTLYTVNNKHAHIPHIYNNTNYNMYLKFILCYKQHTSKALKLPKCEDNTALIMYTNISNIKLFCPECDQNSIDQADEQLR